MKTLFRLIRALLIGVVVLAITLFALLFLPILPGVTSSEELRLSLHETHHIEVFEGLPHQAFERSLLAIESLRTDTTKIGSFPFYTPSSEPSSNRATKLKDLLSSNEGYTRQSFWVAKKCGGFHPDYAIAWKDGGATQYALICLGCSEIEFISPRRSIRYDISSKLDDQLTELLAEYDSKRPKRTMPWDEEFLDPKVLSHDQELEYE